MSVVQYQATMSLDGFIAGPGGDMQWLRDVESVPCALIEGLVHQTGAVLSGARTYRGDDPNAGTDSEGAYGGEYAGAMVVLTHHPDPAPPPGVEFRDDLRGAVARARELAGDGVVAVLGADVARQLLDASLLDEVLVFVAPVMLGSGVRLLDRPDGPPVRLSVIEADGLALRARVVSGPDER